MRRFIILISAMIMAAGTICAEYTIRFKSKPMGEALSELVKKYPDIRLAFIYDELGNYTTSVSVHATTPLQAVRQIVGLNPISVIEKDGKIFAEALQKGRYVFRGRVINEYSEAVPHATVMLLNPKDSVTLTYGVTRENGSFSIPCDKAGVIAKVSCTGYRPLRMAVRESEIGDITLQTLAVNLDSLVVEGNEAELYSDRSVFIPGTRQKNSALDGIDLIDKMAIPMVRVNPLTGALETNSGKPVKAYIDNMPASSSDIKGMNMRDVKRVEFYEFPRDARYEGNPYVVNFVMQQYEYGGYMRLYGYEYFIMNSGYLQGNLRFQYKKMTYDLSAIGFYHNSHHYGSETTEIYRLPQTDGSIREFTRYSETEAAKRKREQYFVTFRATYSSDNVLARNTLSGTIDNTPRNEDNGFVTYTPKDFPDSEYSSFGSNKIRSVRYSGFYWFKMGASNSLTFTPGYSYAHTDQNSRYAEKGSAPIDNEAADNAHNASGRISFTHNFGKESSLNVYANENYNYFRTRYSGSATAVDYSRSLRTAAGITYSITAGNFYGNAGIGWAWDNIKMNDVKSNVSSPSAELSLQYAISNKHRVSGSIDYHTWEPEPSFKSDNVIKSNHLMSYTGNPALVPMKHFGYSLSYIWIPSNRFSLSATGEIVEIKDRYVYNYVATPEGILRTIEQPMGGYALGYFGLTASSSFFDGNLRVRGNVALRYAHSGHPYDYTRWPVTYYLSVNYYLGNFYFSGRLDSPQRYSDGIMVGHWMDYDTSYYLSAGWGNGVWNLNLRVEDFCKWNWKDHAAWFKTSNYDYSTTVFTPAERFKVRLGVTYTFRYGKKVKSTNEPGAAESAASGILRQ